MEIHIRKADVRDECTLFEMIRVFYASPAVLSDVPEEVIRQDISACFDPKLPLDGYIFEADGMAAGYAFVTQCYGTEYGGMVAWLEDLYLKPEYRGLHIASAFFRFLQAEYNSCVRIKLEAEAENEHAIAVYKSRGFEISPYYEMVLDPKQ